MEGSEAPCRRSELDVTQGELAVILGQRPQEEKGEWEGPVGKGRGVWRGGGGQGPREGCGQVSGLGGGAPLGTVPLLTLFSSGTGDRRSRLPAPRVQRPGAGGRASVTVLLEAMRWAFFLRTAS